MSSRFPEDQDDDRLARLEKEVERLSVQLSRSNRAARLLVWLIFGGMVLAAAGLVILHESGLLRLDSFTGAVSKTVESKEFGLYNRDGNRVMLTDYDKFGYPNLVFMDLQKKYKMGVKVWPEGGGTPGLVFYDDTGIRGNLRMDENRGSVLNLLGSGKKGKISLAVSEDGDPSVVITDKQGKVIFEVPARTSEKRADETSNAGGRHEDPRRRP
jgi:hypothetical protein